MDPRSATLQVTRPILFRPFTSLTTAAQDTKTPAFEFVIPRLGGTFILLKEVTWPTRRFVYVFLDQAQLGDTSTLQGLALLLFVGPGSTGNPLMLVVRVEPNGAQAVCTGREYKQAIGAGTTPPFVSVPKVETLAIEPEALASEAAGSYAVAAPILLPATAVAALEQSKPAAIPVLGTGMGIGVTGPVDATPSNPDWVFPVVDPILIAENLTRKYYEAADTFLAASQQIDRPPAANDEEAAARSEGELLRFKKTIADNLLALRDAVPSLSGTFDDTMLPNLPDKFIQEYRTKLDDLVFERELAAFQLIAWLESDLFKQADDWWDRKQGKPDADYEFYMSATLMGIARLAESDRGLQYLMDLRNRNEQGSSPVPSGPLHVVTEFTFRSTDTSDEQLKLVLKVGATVFGVWSAFVTASLAVRQRALKSPNPSTTYVEDLKVFASRLRFTLREGIVLVDVNTLPLEVTLPGGTRTTIFVRDAKLSVGPGVAKLAQKSKLATEQVARICAVLNVGLAFLALRTALEENGDPKASGMQISDLVGASFGLLDQGLALPVLESFRNRMAGKVNMSGAVLGNRVAATLGLLGAITSLVSASLATTQEFDKGDWDEALAHVTEGVGALISATGATIILVSGATGPFALWTITVGTAVSAVGFLWSVFAADSELDQLLKFSAFGRQSAGDAAAPGWSQCQARFTEWDANTLEGLVRQLKAFQQVFYAFDVSGAFAVEAGPKASDGIVRITPSSLRLTSSFILDYTAVYVAQAGQTTTRTGKVTVTISPNGAPVFLDSANNYQNTGAVRRHKDDGKDALDVRLRLVKEIVDGVGSPFELKDLTCRVQMQIPSIKVDDVGKSDGNLIVPTTAKGAGFVKVEAMVKKQVQTELAKSLKD